MENFESVEILAPLRLRFLRQEIPNSGPSLLLLHGYTDTGPAFLRRIFGDSMPNFSFLAPNGAFPVPVPTASGFKEAYSWYFAEPGQKAPLIPGEAAAVHVRALLEAIGWWNRDWIIVGFSQGGFLAPLVARELPRLRGLICVGSGFRSDWYGSNFPKPVHSIHGVEDETVPIERAERDLEALNKIGLNTNLTRIPEMGHKLTAAGAEAVRNAINLLR